MAAVSHMLDAIWLDQARVEEEVYKYHVYAANQGVIKPSAEKKVEVAEAPHGVAEQIAQAREAIHRTLQESDKSISSEAIAKLKTMESENAELKRLLNTLATKMEAIDARLSKLESGKSSVASAPAPAEQNKALEEDDDDDDDIDLFGSDEDDEEAERVRQERLDAYHAKKSKKPTVIAKSNIILDVKPWDDETNMEDLEKSVRSIATDGLIWGPSKLVDIAYGIRKLQISCVVEDDKVGTDFLEEEISKFEDHVQSIDVAAFNKV